MRFVLILAVMLIAFSAVAEDGELFMKNVSKTPELDTNHVTLRVLYQNVPAMTSEDEPTSVIYTDQVGETVLERDYAKPLVVFMCVGTPEGKDGRADLSQVFGAAKEIGSVQRSSTLPKTPTLEHCTNRRTPASFESATSVRIASTLMRRYSASGVL